MLQGRCKGSSRMKNYRTKTKVQKMKNKLLLPALLLTATLASAQPAMGTFSVIPRVGLNLSSNKGDVIYSSSGDETVANTAKMKAGLLAGFDLEWQALPCVAVSLGACYSQQGCRYSNNSILIENGKTSKYKGFSDASTKLDYINVPLFVSCYVAQNLAVKVGVQLGFNMNAKTEYTTSDFTRDEAGNVTYGTPEKVETKIDARAMDVAIPVGISYEYCNVILDVRYNVGLLQTIRNAGVAGTKNQVLALSAGYRFKL